MLSQGLGLGGESKPFSFPLPPIKQLLAKSIYQMHVRTLNDQFLPLCFAREGAYLLTVTELGHIIILIPRLNFLRLYVHVTVPSRNQILFQFFSSASKCNRRYILKNHWS